MHDFLGFLESDDPVEQLELAARTSSYDDIRFGGFDAVNLLLDYLFRKLIIQQTELPAHAAAPVGTRHFDEFRTIQ